MGGVRKSLAKAGACAVHVAHGGAFGNIERLGNFAVRKVLQHAQKQARARGFIQRLQGRYGLALMDLTTRQTQILTDTQLDGSPAFAPNGRLILYASIVGGRGILAAVSSDGRIKQKITSSAQDVREPAWGPLTANR